MPVTVESTSLGELLRLAMKAQGLTQTGVAKRAGCNQSQVSRLCRGQFDDETECLTQVCSVLNIRLRSRAKKSQDALNRIGQLLRTKGARKTAGGRPKRLAPAAAKRRRAIEQALQSIAALV
jgi:transcriptional regulator with XRE-family HTH domain